MPMPIIYVPGATGFLRARRGVALGRRMARKHNLSADLNMQFHELTTSLKRTRTKYMREMKFKKRADAAEKRLRPYLQHYQRMQAQPLPEPELWDSDYDSDWSSSHGDNYSDSGDELEVFAFSGPPDPPPPPAGQKKRMMMKKPIKANKKNANKTSAGKKMTTATNKAKKTGVVAKVVLPVKKRRHVP